MKTPIISSLVILALAAGAMAEADAPHIDKEIRELTKKVDGDLAAGSLTQSDGDELKREISHVQSIRQSEPILTHRTRRDLRQDLAKIHKDLERKETQAKSLPAPSPTP